MPSADQVFARPGPATHRRWVPFRTLAPGAGLRHPPPARSKLARCQAWWGHTTTRPPGSRSGRRIASVRSHPWRYVLGSLSTADHDDHGNSSALWDPTRVRYAPPPSLLPRALAVTPATSPMRCENPGTPWVSLNRSDDGIGVQDGYRTLRIRCPQNGRDTIP